MTQKYDPTKIGLVINHWEPFVNEQYKGFWIDWASEIGFGEYTISKPTHPANKEEDVWSGYSEYMDTNEDKAFLLELLRLMAEGIIIK